MVITVADAMTTATNALRQAGVEGPRQDARIMLASLFKEDCDIIIREPLMELTSDQATTFKTMIERRVRREPVSHILGTREFWSRDFCVSSAVLDPRPDSETLIDAVLTEAATGNGFESMLDLGTGCGCLLLTLLAELSGLRTGLGVDQSVEALQIAGKNAQRLGLEQRAEFLQSDWFSAVKGHYDLIVSNPPYIETAVTRTLQPEVSEYEPIAALDGGVDGLECYRRVISDIGCYLNPNGYVIFEVGKGQAETVSGYLKAADFTEIKTHQDLASVERCVSGRLKK